MDAAISIVLFSGTDDRLSAAADVVEGAVAAGRPVRILLQYWALDAFRADRIDKDHGVSAEAGVEGAGALREMRERYHRRWQDVLRSARLSGRVHISACARSLQTLSIGRHELDPMVSDAHTMATFLTEAPDSPLFI